MITTRQVLRGALRRHGLGLALVVVFTAFTAATLLVGTFEHTPGRGAFWLWWSYDYLIALVSGAFNALLLVVATKWLREVGSAEADHPQE